MITSGFWAGRRVLLTGHTGFKGSWLALMLRRLNARVTGFALSPESGSQLYDLADVGSHLRDLRGDIGDPYALAHAMEDAEIVIHMAAQPLVRESYRTPRETFATNVMGTVNVLEAARHDVGVRVVLVVTTDKCYQNTESRWGFREHDPLGGDDPYSASKAGAEIVTASYRESFLRERGVAVISARAGNVIGGGDFAADRIVPDAMRAFASGKVLHVRNPQAIRPWQHVLDPLCAYLALVERAHSAPEYACAWNFGPDWRAERPVGDVVKAFAGAWGDSARWQLDAGAHPKEATTLRLDTSRARDVLGYVPLLDFDAMVAWTVDWYRAYADGGDMSRVTLDQIDGYLGQRVRLTMPEPFARPAEASVVDPGPKQAIA